MTWDSTTYGGHAETALEAPATTWYFAEGATHGAFSLFYLLQNPNDQDTSVTVNYLRLAPERPWSSSYTVPANSRLTIPVDAEGPELEATDVAARIDSTLPIIAERAMYSTADRTADIRRGARRRGRHRAGVEVVPRGGRDRRVLRSLRARREPESGALRRCRLPICSRRASRS